ncbi:MAG: hypothetical protein IT331_08165 [Anaerolineae bacterium]|nr:hypothetical protein [Anaerolineae bacterium]
MLAKEKALEVATQAPAEDFSPVVLRQPIYIIADAPCQDPEPKILPLAQIAAQLRDAAMRRLLESHNALQEIQTRIAQERAEREQKLEIAHATIAVLQTQLTNLDAERAQYEKSVQILLTGGEREQMLAQLQVSFNARQIELESEIQAAEHALANLNYEHYAAIIGEEVELQLLNTDIETLTQAAPEVAKNIEHELAAPFHLERAIALAHEGQLADAEHELQQAQAGKLSETDIAAAETAILEAKRRAHARELIASIQAVGTENAGAVLQLKRLALRAENLGVASNVATFLNRALKLARATATERYREATIQADYLASQGFIPCVGDGRIEAWQQTRQGWTLIELWSYQQGVWVGHRPRARVTRTDIPRRVRRSRWFKHMADHRPQTADDNQASSVVGDAASQDNGNMTLRSSPSSGHAA